MELKRFIQSDLTQWHHTPDRLPLVLRGARQVGKSTAVATFGKNNFAHFHEFNFQKNTSLHSVFEGDLDPLKLLTELERRSQKKKIDPTRDLVFFDEIQECPRALTSLKYFAEQLPELAVISAGSYLGLVKTEEAFPVGKVNFLSMFPLTFEEFILNYDPQLHEIYRTLSLEQTNPIDPYWHGLFLEALTYYLCVGGLPKPVYFFLQSKDDPIVGASKARAIQHELITSYQSDFSKHAGTVNANHILRVFDAIVSQLGQTQDESVKKFKFTGVIPKQKGFDRIIGPLTWLEKSRLTLKSFTIQKIEHPLKAFIKENQFKSYFFDVGLLQAALDTPTETILQSKVGLYKGFIAENFVAQELFFKADQPLFSWQEGNCEVEFILVRQGQILPAEVKFSNHARQAKSFHQYVQKHHPVRGYKLTLQNRGVHAQGKEHLLTLPLYLAGKL